MSTKEKNITLMTVVASGSTKSAQALLAKHGIPKAKSYADLEMKLCKLWYNSEDKIQIEKELAEIHPHKKWLLERLQPATPAITEEVKIEPVIEQSSFEGYQNPNQANSYPNHCNCPICIEQMKSSFDGSKNKESKANSFMDYMPAIAMVSIVVVGLVVVLKITK